MPPTEAQWTDLAGSFTPRIASSQKLPPNDKPLQMSATQEQPPLSQRVRSNNAYYGPRKSVQKQSTRTSSSSIPQGNSFAPSDQYDEDGYKQNVRPRSKHQSNQWASQQSAAPKKSPRFPTIRGNDSSYSDTSPESDNQYIYTNSKHLDSSPRQKESTNHQSPRLPRSSRRQSFGMNNDQANNLATTGAPSRISTRIVNAPNDPRILSEVSLALAKMAQQSGRPETRGPRHGRRRSSQNGPDRNPPGSDKTFPEDYGEDERDSPRDVEKVVIIQHVVYVHKKTPCNRSSNALE